MARKPRIEFPGALYHVISRGNQRNRVFISDKDYEDYLNRLWKYHEKFHFILYAYCLMPNHIHLLIETGEEPLSRIMQAIQFSYTQSFNRRNKKVGHLFQGRYKAILCDEDEYLLQLIRYIHLNPVRAKIVENPMEYRWSSHRAILGIDKKARCDTQKILGLFGRTKRTAKKMYEEYILADIAAGHKSEYYQTKDQRILGEDGFAEEMILMEEKKSSFHYEIDIPEIVKNVSKEWDIAATEIRSHRRNRRGSFGRGLVIYLAKRLAGKSTSELGRYFSRGDSGAAKCYRIIEEKLVKDAELNRKIEKICKALTAGAKIKLK